MTAAVTPVQTMPSGLWCGWNPTIEDNRALDAQVDGQTDEGESDQTHRPALPLLAYVRELPEHNGRCANLNEAIQAEPR